MRSVWVFFKINIQYFKIKLVDMYRNIDVFLFIREPSRSFSAIELGSEFYIHHLFEMGCFLVILSMIISTSHPWWFTISKVWKRRGFVRGGSSRVPGPGWARASETVCNILEQVRCLVPHGTYAIPFQRGGRPHCFLRPVYQAIRSHMFSLRVETRCIPWWPLRRDMCLFKVFVLWP